MPLGAPLTVIFARRENARRGEDAPASEVLRGAVTFQRVGVGYWLPAGAGMPTGGSAAPGGLPPLGRGMLPPRCRRVPMLRRDALAVPSLQLAIPLG